MRKDRTRGNNKLQLNCIQSGMFELQLQNLYQIMAHIFHAQAERWNEQ